MTNFEKYHEEMIKKKLAAVKNGKPARCGSISCEECYRFEEGDCNNIALLEWIAEEYEEPKPTLTKRQRALCEALEYGWIARDGNNALWHYSLKPEKDIEQNKWFCFHGVCFWLDTQIFLDFPFIKWEDKEPHSIEEMLTWEVRK